MSTTYASRTERARSVSPPTRPVAPARTTTLPLKFSHDLSFLAALRLLYRWLAAARIDRQRACDDFVNWRRRLNLLTQTGVATTATMLCAIRFVMKVLIDNCASCHRLEILDHTKCIVCNDAPKNAPLE